MRSRQQFVRKIVYLAVLAGLLLPLSWLSQPASVDRGGQRQPGGKLAQLRDDYSLSQARLGDIDPVSETMKLATLGMRGPAANLLWTKALYYQKIKDFTNLSATLEQITKLQPNFIRVWIFQGWNLSYNVSVEFDDYRDRYFWVIRGVRFTQEGLEYNRDEPTLLREVGRVISRKMGQSDEHVQFRKLFRADDDFHGSSADSERDSWRVGKKWFERCVEVIEKTGRRPKGSMDSEASPLMYLAEAPLCQLYYAATIEEEGTFGDEARAAWAEAQRDWEAYGEQDIPVGSGTTVKLGESNYRFYIDRVNEFMQRLEDSAPGARERLLAERRASLPPEELQVLDIPVNQRDEAQHALAAKAYPKLIVSHIDVANSLPPGQGRNQALKLAVELTNYEIWKSEVEFHRSTVNYGYWQLRAEAEQEPEALAAHELLFQAQQAHRDVDLEKAAELYTAGFQKWADLLNKDVRGAKKYVSLVEDGITGEMMVDTIRKYRACLKQLDAPFPTDFPLARTIELHDQSGQAQPASDRPAEQSDPDATPEAE
ncbi:MAG: hypothetical protein K2Y37_16910 [Pirellulales bacterium]|nr:hypothetical protein [Pirellulales bacterium]